MDHYATKEQTRTLRGVILMQDFDFKGDPSVRGLMPPIDVDYVERDESDDHLLWQQKADEERARDLRRGEEILDDLIGKCEEWDVPW